MKNKIKKYLNLIIVIVLLLTTILPNLHLIGTKVYASTSKVVYNGKAIYGPNIVGDFTVNGEQAFCMEHAKDTPPTNTEITSNVYGNEDIAKCLYYRMGW